MKQQGNRMTQSIGMIVGKFYPLHQGHINMILQARQLVDELIVFVCSDSERDLKLFEESAMTRLPTSEDRTNWAKQVFATIPGIQVESFIEDGIPAYPNGWQAWSERLQATLNALNIKPTIIFSSELQDEALYRQYFNLPVRLMDPPRAQFDVSATKIRTEPYRYWHFIPTHIRPFFTKRIVIDTTFSDTLLLQSVIQLFQSIDQVDSSQLAFIVLDQSQLPQSIHHYHQEMVRINGIIGSPAFIEQTLGAIEQINLNKIQNSRDLPYYNMMAPSIFEADETDDNALMQFNELNHFVAQILEMPATK